MTTGGLVYHVLNRANARMKIFQKDADYAAFERVLIQAVERHKMRLLAYCVMPNHWHLVVWPQADGDLTKFVGWLTLTHTQRWHAHRNTSGLGHIYQGRFKSFLVETDEYLWAVCRYVERNPVRCGLVASAEQWRWSSLWRRHFGDGRAAGLLSPWPIEIPADWLQRVNRPETDAELLALRDSVAHGAPLGSAAWTQEMVKLFAMENVNRAPGRPRTPRR